MKFGVREICDVVLKAKSNVKIGSHTFQKGEPVIYFDTAKTSTMESAATTVYATGGRGNSRLIAWEGEKTLTFTMEDALISEKGLAILSGADLIQASDEEDGQKVTAHVTETVIAEAATNVHEKAISIKIEKTLNTSQPIYAMVLDGNGEMSGVPVLISPIDTSAPGSSVSPGATRKFYYNEGVLTYVPSTEEATGTNKFPLFYKNDVIMLDYYTDYSTDAVQIDITPDKFAGYYYLEASTLFRRQSDGVDLPAEFIIPKVKIQSNFTFTMASSGDPSSFTFTMDAFPDYTITDKTKKVLASIQILGADDNYDLTSVGEEDTTPVKRYTYGQDRGPYLSKVKLTSDDTPTGI